MFRFVLLLLQCLSECRLSRTALTHYLDVNNPPRTNVLRELSIHASDPEEAAKLKSMGSGLDKEGYNDWVVDKARQAVEY